MGQREKAIAIAEMLEQWEAEYRSGNAARCLDVISLCLQFNYAVPQWAINHFVGGAGRYERAEARTLDEAFDIRRPKGWHQNRARQRYLLGIKAHMEARALVDSKKPTLMGKPYSVEAATAEVAEKLGMKDADVERWYYDKKLMKELGYPQTVRRKSKKTEGD